MKWREERKRERKRETERERERNREREREREREKNVSGWRLVSFAFSCFCSFWCFRVFSVEFICYKSFVCEKKERERERERERDEDEDELRKSERGEEECIHLYIWNKLWLFQRIHHHLSQMAMHVR